MLALVVCCGVALEFPAAGRSRRPKRACIAPVSLPKNAASRSRTLSTAVWSSLHNITSNTGNKRELVPGHTCNQICGFSHVTQLL
ncbi:hypothetical protein Y032_0011g1463 [Ancylostoma ceylanicum]|uniref:Secreted protein n=1 Tax=Ancylostoma ceylanicum TaxID=53326 RepID=A0A016VFX8_9BILA|nr:hypothetical protein Y032_0011g1463 [Ancylostoma ceylanicum]